MNSFDTTQLRKAVQSFSSKRPAKFQELLPAKDLIEELRQKQASFTAIAELLTQHGLPTSKTAIAGFCHEILGEVRKRRRRTRKDLNTPPTQDQNL
jgi:hypothetical protein